MKENKLSHYIELAKIGDEKSIEILMSGLNQEMTLKESRELDYALSFITKKESMDVLKKYLFEGSQIQRNYAALFFGRNHEYILLREAYDLGLIDEKQAFSR